jgi:hypothetical protein
LPRAPLDNGARVLFCEAIFSLLRREDYDTFA